MRAIIKKASMPIFVMVIYSLFVLNAPLMAGTATISWDPPTAYMDGTPGTAAGFKIYYGSAYGNYSQTIDVGNVATYSISSLTDGNTYYFAVTAYDSSGIESEYSNEFIWNSASGDSTPPTATLNVNSGAMYTTSATVELTLEASDISGVIKMCVSDTVTCSAWEPYSTSKIWTLPSGDGIKTVYSWFKDGFGNANTEPYSASIILDAAPPTGSILINSGAAFTRDANVTLTPFATDANGIAQMRFSNDNATWSAAENYAATTAWSVPAGDGTKVVYVKFKDNAGNWSTPYSGSITLDTLQPSVSISAVTTPTGVNTQTISGTVEYGASVYVSTDTEASDGVAMVNGSSWIYTITGLEAGVNNIIITATDSAGNTTSVISTVTFNGALFTSASPVPNIFINTGTVGYTLSREVSSGTVTFTRTDGNTDLHSPHIYNFTATDMIAGTHTVNTGFNLVNGTVYTIQFSATDSSGFTEYVTNTNVTYDATTASVTINSPASSSIINNTAVNYTLSEDISGAEIVFTGDDGISPHVYEMSQDDRTAGTHTVNTGALLLNGVFYTLSIQNIVDQAGNQTAAVSNINIKYDTTGVVISDTYPTAGSIITTATVRCTLSEQASAGKVTFTRTSGKMDKKSPQVYYFNYSDLAAGAHLIDTNLPLVRGTTYTVSFDAVDLVGNSSTTVSNAEVTFKR